MSTLGLQNADYKRKVEEIYPPRVDELVEITANTYTREQVFSARGTM